MDNNTNFYISGFISISLFMLLGVLATSMLFSPLKNNSFALKKDKFISVSIVMPKLKSKASTSKPKSSFSPSSEIAKVKNIDVNNLFSDVWTKKIVHKKKTLKVKNNRLIKQLQKKIRKSKNNNVASFNKQIKNLENIKSTKDVEASSSALEVNEFLAKIQAIVYQYFHVPHNSEGHSVKTVIELDALGRVLDFRVLQYSENQALNSEADKIKKRIQNVIFPKNPQNKSTRTIVVLISEE